MPAGTFDRAIQACEPMIRAICRGARSAPWCYEDLCQEARLAVWQALSRAQQPLSKTKLRSIIRSAIAHYERDFAFLIRVPACRQEPTAMRKRNTYPHGAPPIPTCVLAGLHPEEIHRAA